MSRTKLPDKKLLLKRHEEVRPLYKQLIQEMRFILEKAISEKRIKIHGIQDRIKDFDSFYNKVVFNNIIKDPFEKINDIAGIRIICLYRADLESIGKLISEQLEVIETDIKTRVLKATEFGYMSDHYIVKLLEKCKGPRYDKIKPLKCEIQVRTILMDAWDSVSHHLDYKKENDVPSQLRRDFFALSGLFYVADTHFEMFRGSVKRLQTQLIKSVKRDRFDFSQEMNLDTLRAYLKWKLPDRKRGNNRDYSELLSELREIKYYQFGKLDEALNRSTHAAEASEKDSPPEEKVSKGKFRPTRYLDIGIVRTSLDLFDSRYKKLRAKQIKATVKKYNSRINFKKYRAMIRKQ